MKTKQKTIKYALLFANPLSEPPFDIELGFDEGDTFVIKDCSDFPAGIENLKKYCTENSIKFAESFTLLYPIYMNAMGTDCEGLMHQLAWMIKDIADKNKWKFDRVGGLTGKTSKDFID